MNQEPSDFEVMQKICDENTDDGILAFPVFLGGQKTKKGACIDFAAPEVALDYGISGSHFFVAYAVKKEDFNRIKAELQKNK